MNVVSSCAVIWNFLLSEKDALSEEEISAADDAAAESVPAKSDMLGRQNSLFTEGRNKRRALINSYFALMAEQ